MKKIAGFVAMFAACFFISASASPIIPPEGPDKADTSSMSKAKWEVFSESLVDALASNHEGLQQAALRMIIQYGDALDVDAALFDIMKIYRSSEDSNMRRMAVVALGSMNNSRAIYFLERAVRFEKTPCVKKTILAVIAENKIS